MHGLAHLNLYRIRFRVYSFGLFVFLVVTVVRTCFCCCYSKNLQCLNQNYSHYEDPHMPYMNLSEAASVDEGF